MTNENAFSTMPTISVRSKPASFNVQRDVFEHTDRILANTFSNCDAITAIYDYGQRTHPGISDIDLIIVFNDKKSGSLALGIAHEISKLKEQLDKIGARNGATIMLLNEAFFYQLNYIDTPKFRLLFGREGTVKSVDHSTAVMRNITNLCEWIVWNHYKYGLMLKKQQESGDVFRFIKCIAYTLETISTLFEKPNLQYVTKAKALRDQWVDKKLTAQELGEYAKRSMAQLLGRTEEVLRHMENQGLCSTKAEPGIDLSLDIASRVDFISKISDHELSAQTKHSHNRRFSDTFILPSTLNYSFSHYATKTGSKLAANIEASLKRDVGSTLYLANDFGTYLNRRFDLIEQHHETNNAHSLSGGLFKLGWYNL